MVKKITLLLIVAILNAALLIPAFAEPVETKELPFKLDFPSSWSTYKETKAGIDSYSFTREPIKQPSDRFLVGISVFWFTGKFLTADWHTFINTQEDFYKTNGLEFKDMGVVATDSCPAYVFLFANQKVKFLIAYIKKGYDLVIVQAEAPPQEWAEYENILKKGIDSFVFSKK